MLSAYIFQDWGYLFALLLIPLVLWYYFQILSKRIPSLKITSVKNTFKTSFWKVHSPALLLVLGLTFLILALARPQGELSEAEMREKNIEGIDIVIAQDISGSMAAQDLLPNRLEASKVMAAEFINGRKNDRIGLVLYAAESFTQCPLTNDKSTLLKLLANSQMGMIEDGTAIGTGLATAINRLRESKAKSRAIILLTDGINNAGKLSPIDAAEIAKELGIRVYTIGIGARFDDPFMQFFIGEQKTLDEDLLKEMATIAGGQYYRADSDENLNLIYHEIGRLETDILKTIQIKVDAPESFAGFLVWGLLMITASVILGLVIFRKTI